MEYAPLARMYMSEIGLRKLDVMQHHTLNIIKAPPSSFSIDPLSHRKIAAASRAGSNVQDVSRGGN